MLPAVFVSHGAPTLPFDDVPARDFMRGLGAALGRPRAVLAVSAHWDTDMPATNALTANDTIHDFHGFPRPLYDLRYAAPGDALLAREVSGLLNGFGAQTDTMRGLDHGAWVPLMLMYPGADIPVVQLSVQSGKGAAHHVALGRALAGLRQDNVLVLGSGGFVHNLRQIAPPGSAEPQWAADFAGWMHERLMEGDEAALVDYRSRAPHAALAHPSEEHLMPLLVAYGAGGEKTKAARLHSSATFGSLRMDAYSFA
ncbi:MAG TPA: class III extradiol ring-cleavage dioxygenase [Rhizomicrobium sp.]|jgi:4,5-DOPA dioxygenase extradiol